MRSSICKPEIKTNLCKIVFHKVLIARDFIYAIMKSLVLTAYPLYSLLFYNYELPVILLIGELH